MRTARRPLTGEVFDGEYLLQRLLGEGGMGLVFAARHPDFRQEVALKIVRPGAGRRVAERFLSEARLTRKLDHPAIVKVYDARIAAQGLPYLVMELLRGEDLRALFTKAKRLPAASAVGLLLPVALGIRAMHQAGVLHRDLKPENIFLEQTPQGMFPKLLDLGVAQPLELARRRRLTDVGLVAGSPDYMSPEQASGEINLDERSDIFAFTLVLYEAIAGRSPFSGKTPREVMQAIVHAKPARLEGANAMTRDLNRIIERGLEKERARRWQSMGELGSALGRWLLEQGEERDAAGNPLAAW
jgi:serine/threonine-protein kinase